jgi:hypothetical protein
MSSGGPALGLIARSSMSSNVQACRKLALCCIAACHELTQPMPIPNPPKHPAYADAVRPWLRSLALLCLLLSVLLSCQIALLVWRTSIQRPGLLPALGQCLAPVGSSFLYSFGGQISRCLQSGAQRRLYATTQASRSCHSTRRALVEVEALQLH